MYFKLFWQITHIIIINYQILSELNSTFNRHRLGFTDDPYDAILLRTQRDGTDGQLEKTDRQLRGLVAIAPAH